MDGKMNGYEVVVQWNGPWLNLQEVADICQGYEHSISDLERRVEFLEEALRYLKTRPPKEANHPGETWSLMEELKWKKLENGVYEKA